VIDNSTETEQSPAPDGKRGGRRNAVVAGAVVAVLAIAGGVGYLAGSGGSTHRAVSGAGSSVTSSATPGGGVLQPGGPKSTSPAGAGMVEPAKAYAAAGTQLTVYFFGQACMKYSVAPDESAADKVVVKVTAVRTAKVGEMCSMLVSLQHATVALRAPLNGRSVVDAQSGKTLPVQIGRPGSIPGGRETHGPTSVNS
jgi:hypothetical protein